jgi:cytochrome c
MKILKCMALALATISLAGLSFASQESKEKGAAQDAKDTKTSAKGDAAEGEKLFEACSVCHTTTEEKKMGPGLKGLFKKEKLSNGKKVSEETVRAVINEGGNGMPPYEEMLTADEKSHVIAYLKTL